MSKISTIIVAEQPEAGEMLAAELSRRGHQITHLGTSLQAALLQSRDVTADLIVSQCDVMSDDWLQHFRFLNECCPLPLVVFTADDRPHVIENAIAAGVSAYVVEGLERDRIVPVVTTAMARFRQQQLHQQQLKELKAALDDRKVIDRAKGLVMQQRNCSENEAYSLLRNTAMNQNLRLSELARNIINTASLLDARQAS